MPAISDRQHTGCGPSRQAMTSRNRPSSPSRRNSEASRAKRSSDKLGISVQHVCWESVIDYIFWVLLISGLAMESNLFNQIEKVSVLLKRKIIEVSFFLKEYSVLETRKVLKKEGSFIILVISLLDCRKVIIVIIGTVVILVTCTYTTNVPVFEVLSKQKGYVVSLSVFDLY